MKINLYKDIRWILIILYIYMCLEKKPLARVIILDQINNKYMDPDILKKYINFVKGKKNKNQINYL